MNKLAVGVPFEPAARQRTLMKALQTVVKKSVTVPNTDRSHSLDGSTSRKDATAHKAGAASRRRHVVYVERGLCP